MPGYPEQDLEVGLETNPTGSKDGHRGYSGGFEISDKDTGTAGLATKNGLGWG